MFKVVFKLMTLSFIILGLGSLFLGDKALAANPNCPSGSNAPNDWGFNQGESQDNMAGLTVHAHVGNMTNGVADPNQGDPLNVKYDLNSALPNAPSGTNYVLNGHPKDERIFQLDSSGNKGNLGRTSQRYFGTGGARGDSLYANAGNSTGFNCSGWDAMGPGRSGEIGNRWGLDCGQDYYSGGVDRGTIQSRFWISDITNPSGQSGKWEVKMYNKDGGLINDINNFTSSSADANSNYFTVVNGATVRLELIWHADPPPPNPPANTCTYFSVNGSKLSRKEVHITGVSGGRGRLNQDPSTDWNHPPDFDEYVPAPVGTNVSPGSYTKEWWYTPTANTIHVKVTQWDWNGSSWVSSVLQDYNKTCFTATCQITSVDGDGPNGVVLAGGTAHVHGRYWNTSPPPDFLPIWSPAVQDSDKLSSWNGIHTLYNGPAYNSAYGYSYGFSFDMPNVSDGYFNFTPVYFGNPPGAIGSGCQISFPIYYQFSLVPKATLSYNTAENPGPIGYSTYITNNSGAAVSAPTTSTFTSTPYGGGSPLCSNRGPVNTNGPYNPGGPNYTIPPGTCTPSSINAGDQYCSQIDLTSYNQGFVGSDGSLVGLSLSGTTTDKKCVTVVNEPYFKVFGTGVSAGGSFQQANGTCSANPGAGLLAGWNDNSGARDRGAGSQLSALALIKITGFASAQTSASNSPTNLTFANASLPAGAIGTDRESPALGGQFNPGSCYPLPDASISTDPTSDATTHNSSVNDLDPSGITIPAGDNKSIFVNGDVYISHNILYGSGWDINNAPSFVLHATGNIYIDPGVTELDGLYIAHTKSNGTGGKIYTCATAVNTPCQISGLYNQSNNNNQLLIRGAFVASQVNFMRTYGSLRDSQSGEQLTGSSHTCSHSGNGNKPVCAAEIFEFSPELYLSTPAIQLQNMGGPQWDAITSLPPVL